MPSTGKSCIFKCHSFTYKSDFFCKINRSYIIGENISLNSVDIHLIYCNLNSFFNTFGSISSVKLVLVKLVSYLAIMKSTSVNCIKRYSAYNFIRAVLCKYKKTYTFSGKKILKLCTKKLSLILFSIEIFIFWRLKRFKNLSIIFISHNFSGKLINEYDEILVMENGRLLDHGPYEELLSSCAYFKRICEIKFG